MLYRKALQQDLLARSGGAAAATAQVPKSWRIAFDAAHAARGWVVQHCMLGVNADIDHDLALALLIAGIDTDPPRRYADHTAVNLALERATLALRSRYARAKGRGGNQVRAGARATRSGGTGGRPFRRAQRERSAAQTVALAGTARGLVPHHSARQSRRILFRLVTDMAMRF